MRFSRTGLFVNTRFRSKARAMLSPCSLFPTVRFALLSGPSCPVSVSFVGFVSRQPLPLVNGSPALRVLRADLTPNSSSVHLSFPSASLTSQPRGTSWASQVLWCFSSHMPCSCATPGRPSETSPLAVALYGLLDLRLHRRLLSWT